MVMSEKKAKELGAPVMAKVVAQASAGLGFIKDAEMFEIYEGSKEIEKQIVARHLLKKQF